MTAWIPALDGVEAQAAGGRPVADVGCGHGASTILLAQAYPASTFVGFDYHDGVDRARPASGPPRPGVADRVRFEVAAAQDFPGTDYDLVCIFDALHDMGDPVGAARHIRAALAARRHLAARRAVAGDRIEDNLNPVGRIFYSAST